jgi:hypothetical protein
VYSLREIDLVNEFNKEFVQNTSKYRTTKDASQIRDVISLLNKVLPNVIRKTLNTLPLEARGYIKLPLDTHTINKHVGVKWSKELKRAVRLSIETVYPIAVNKTFWGKLVSRSPYKFNVNGVPGRSTDLQFSMSYMRRWVDEHISKARRLGWTVTVGQHVVNEDGSLSILYRPSVKAIEALERNGQKDIVSNLFQNNGHMTYGRDKNGVLRHTFASVKNSIKPVVFAGCTDIDMQSAYVAQLVKHHAPLFPVLSAFNASTTAARLNISRSDVKMYVNAAIMNPKAAKRASVWNPFSTIGRLFCGPEHGLINGHSLLKQLQSDNELLNIISELSAWQETLPLGSVTNLVSYTVNCETSTDAAYHTLAGYVTADCDTALRIAAEMNISVVQVTYDGMVISGCHPEFIERVSQETQVSWVQKHDWR